MREAVALLVDKRIGAVVVVDEAGLPMGIVSERDVVRELARNDNVLNEPIDRVMTSDVIIARPGDDTKAVSKTMTVKRFRHLPVMDHHELVGIVSRPKRLGSPPVGSARVQVRDAAALERAARVVELLVHVHAEHHELVGGELLRELLELRHRGVAGRAPGGPEIHEHDFAALLVQHDVGVTRDGARLEVGCAIALLERLGLIGAVLGNWGYLRRG